MDSWVKMNKVSTMKGPKTQQRRALPPPETEGKQNNMYINAQMERRASHKFTDSAG